MEGPSEPAVVRPKTEPCLDEPCLSSAESAGFAWQMCNDHPTTSRTAIKEKSLKDAKHYMEELYDLISTHIQDNDTADAETLRHWINRFQALKEQDAQYETLVGVVGQTGAGKTSLLNALLDATELLPSGQEQAATAVSCKVAWNQDLKPGHENWAEIHFQSVEEVSQELLRTLNAAKMHSEIRAGKHEYQNEKEQDDDLAQMAEEFREGMSKISAVWPDVEEDRIELLAEGSPEELIKAASDIVSSNEDVLRLLESQVKVIYNSDLTKLGKEIKPYLDCTKAVHGDSSEFSAWPVIRTVNIHCRSDILKTVSLVDLPGLGDNVESRSKIAREYNSRLDLSLIVADIERAADNSIAIGLMNEFDQMRMQMDGRCNQNGFGVVLSKMESLYLRTYLSGPTASSDPLVQHHEEVNKQASDKIGQLHKEQSKLEKTVEKLEKKIEVKKGKRSKLPSANGSRHERLLAEIGKGEKEIKEAECRLEAIPREEATLVRTAETSQAHLTHWAVKARNSFVRGRMQTDFRKSQRRLASQGTAASGPSQASQASERPMGVLEVIPTSVQAFLEVKGRGKPLVGFPTEVYTGIPFLKQWILRATAERRERHLDEVLSGFETIMSGLQQWSTSNSHNQSIALDPNLVRAELGKTQKKYKKMLIDRLEHLSLEIKDLDPLRCEEKARAYFKASCKGVIGRWLLKYPDNPNNTARLHHSSYNAIVRRDGGPYKPGGRNTEYKWTTHLAMPIYEILQDTWRTSFNVRMPKLWKPFAKDLHAIWRNYIKELEEVAASFDPMLGKYFNDIKTELFSSKDEVAYAGKSQLYSFAKAAGRIRDDATDTVKNSMQPAFDVAKEISGTGRFHRQRLYFDEYADANAVKVFNHAWHFMQHKIDARKHKTHITLTKSGEQAFKSTEVQVRSVLENLIGGSGVTGLKVTLRERVQKVLADWRSQWQCPKGYEDHILLQKLGIPEVLRDEDLKMVKTEVVDDVSDSDEDSDEAEDDSD